MTTEEVEKKESEQFLDRLEPEIKVYKRRWLILIIYMYYAGINTTQILQYCSVTPLIVKYYNVSTTAVEWTSIISMALYPILIFPVSMIINKKGLRMAGLIGCVGTLIGTAVKVFVRSDLFWVLFMGQAILGVSLLSIWSLPAKIASIWFCQEEISTANSIGMFGVQLGIAVGFAVPPIIIKYSEDLEVIGHGIKLLHWIQTGMVISAVLAVLLYFPDQPPLPPTAAQAVLRDTRKFSSKEFYRSIRRLLVSKGFMINLAAFTFNICAYSALSTLLTQYVLEFFEGAYEHAGRMGFLMVIFGMVGSISFGIILDKTRKYKELAAILFLGATIVTTALIYFLQIRNMLWTYIACGFAGLFSSGYVLVGFELTIELTYPTDETTTTGILLAISQLFATLFTMLNGYLNIWFGSYWSMASQVACLALGALVQFFVPNKLLRQEAFERAKREKHEVKA